jgi:hypothetical protein
MFRENSILLLGCGESINNLLSLLEYGKKKDRMDNQQVWGRNVGERREKNKL